jgi:D-2-hydroxyacid dehydrogenase (NADP+)
LLIDDPEAARYATALGSEFAELEIRTGMTVRETIARIASADALITFGHNVDAALIAKARTLKWVQALSTGTDHLERALVGRPEIALSSARGIHGRPVAEYVLMAMLALSRDLPGKIAAQRARVWNRTHSALLAGKLVGIAGMGVIGQAVARRCRAFEMRIVGFGSELREDDSVDEFLTYRELPETVGELDFLVIVTPLTDRTRGMFDRVIFSAMKATSYVVNVGRGATIIEEDLIAALRDRRIAGAALDAFVQEPLPHSSPLWDLSNVIVTPHIAGAHQDYHDDVLAIVRHNLALFLDGRTKVMMNLVARK